VNIVQRKVERMCNKLANKENRRRELTADWKSVLTPAEVLTDAEVISGLVSKRGFCETHAQALVAEVEAVRVFLLETH
jgi:hypothetical protein